MGKEAIAYSYWVFPRSKNLDIHASLGGKGFKKANISECAKVRVVLLHGALCTAGVQEEAFLLLISFFFFFLSKYDFNTVNC